MTTPKDDNDVADYANSYYYYLFASIASFNQQEEEGSKK